MIEILPRAERAMAASKGPGMEGGPDGFPFTQRGEKRVEVRVGGYLHLRRVRSRVALLAIFASEGLLCTIF